MTTAAGVGIIVALLTLLAMGGFRAYHSHVPAGLADHDARTGSVNQFEVCRCGARRPVGDRRWRRVREVTS